MYEEPEDDQPQDEDDRPDRPRDAATQAREKSDEFRMHAELCAVFEGPRKFDAELHAGLDSDRARDMQKKIAKLEKSRMAETPAIVPDSAADAAELLNLPATRELSTGDYHIRRRPGEVMVFRWLAGEEQVDAFYHRLQAHFDAALN